MVPEQRIATHPGAVLREDYLGPLGVTSADLADHIGHSRSELEQLVNEREPVTAELAWLLAMAFNTTPQFWLNLQLNHDLTRTRPDHDVPALTG